MKTPRQKYFEDYRVEKEAANNKKGYKLVYVYKGEWYGWNENSPRLQKRKRLYVTAALIRTLLLVFCGVQRVSLNTAGAVAIPGLISIVSIMYEWIGIVQFCLAKELMQAKDCKRMYSYIEKGSAVTGLCYGICTIAGFRRLILNGADAASVLVTLGFALCTVISFFVYFRHEKLSYQKEIEAEVEELIDKNM